MNRDANSPGQGSTPRNGCASPSSSHVSFPGTAPDGQVKSAGRVLDILEWFAEHQRPATIQALASALVFPHSSATALLNSLRARGYLDYDGDHRTFVPNARLLRLTNWLGEEPTQMGRILRLLEDVREAVGEAVFLATREGGEVRYDQVLLSPAPLQMVIQPGTRRPLHRTATGIVLLGALPMAERIAALTRSIANEPEDEQSDRMVSALRASEQARRTGWYESGGSMSAGLSVIAARMGQLRGLGDLSIGIGGPVERVADKRDAILTLLEKVTGNTLVRPLP